jgi:hypothetical protein
MDAHIMTKFFDCDYLVFAFSVVVFDVVDDVSGLSIAFTCDKHYVCCCDADSFHLDGIYIFEVGLVGAS